MAAPNYGTSNILDTLAANVQTIAQIGEDTIWDGVDKLLATHNRILTELTSNLVERSTDRLRAWGGQPEMGMEELDEYAMPDAQKVTTGTTCGYPLRKYGATLQWTYSYFKKARGKDIAAQLKSMINADVNLVTKMVKTALFNPTNYNFVDRLVDNVSASIPLPVKALINADSSPIPPGPNGESFNGASHTHYTAVASGGTMTEAEFAANLVNVLEHFRTGSAMIYINQAEEATVRGYTDFRPFYDSSTIVSVDTTRGNGTLDVVQIYNRAIGTYRGAEVWVKPWMPASYVLALMNTPEAPKPLVWRFDEDYGDGLALKFEDENHPLRARSYERYFGLGAWGRLSAAILYKGGTSYAAPTFT